MVTADKKKNIAQIPIPTVSPYFVAMKPRMNGEKAEIPLPALKQNPAPKVLTRVGNNSPKY